MFRRRKLISTRFAVVAAVALWGMALAPGLARANLTPSVSVTYGSLVPGAHANFTVVQTYTGTYTGVPSGAATTSGDDLKRWIIEAPAGLAGNPNAIPVAQRCTESAFASANVNPFACPASAAVGTASLQLGVDATGLDTGAPIAGTIFLIKTDPDVPTVLGTIFPTSGTSAIVSRSVITPMTNGNSTQFTDFRLQTVADDNIGRPNVGTPAAPVYGHIKSITQVLLGTLPNTNTFLTNPSRCTSWDTALYGRAYDTNSNVDADPLSAGTNSFVKSTVNSQAPNCAALPSYAPVQTVSFDSSARDLVPSVVFNTAFPGVPGTDVTKSAVVTLPKSITSNIQSLENLCTTAQRDARACPDNTIVGSLSVQTPFIAAGMRGIVNVVENGAKGIPDLAIFVDGPFRFRIDVSNNIVNNQIVSTFDNLPQLGFSNFSLKLYGGTLGLLKTRACPSGNRTPEDGPITYAFTSYTGQTTTTSYTPPFAACHKLKLKKPKTCARSTLKFKPTIGSRSLARKVVLYFGSKKADTSRKSPFTVVGSVRKLTRGKTYKAKIKVTYADKTVKTSSRVSFKRCR